MQNFYGNKNNIFINATIMILLKKRNLTYFFNNMRFVASLKSTIVYFQDETPNCSINITCHPRWKINSFLSEISVCWSCTEKITLKIERAFSVILRASPAICGSFQPSPQRPTVPQQTSDCRSGAISATAGLMTLTFPLTSAGPGPTSAALKFYIFSAEIAIPLRLMLIPIFHLGLPLPILRKKILMDVWASVLFIYELKLWSIIDGWW